MPTTQVAASAGLRHKLFVFDTHPIQYRSPVFKALHECLPNLRVFFLGEKFDGNRWWFNEVNKIPKQKWELSLREDFPNQVLAHADSIRFTQTVRKLFSAERPDAVLTYGYYLPQHWALWALCKWMKIPLIFVGETFSRGTSLRRLPKQMIQPLFFSGVSQFVSIGKRNLSFYKSFGITDDRISQAKYCIDTSFFSLPADKSSEARARLRRELKIPADAFVQLFVGRLFERKRPWDMFAIHDRLKHIPNLHTILIGNGSLQSELEATSPKDGRVHLVGFKNQAETRDFYHASDLLVVPSEFETWGLVVNEAFAAGTPALVTDSCGVAGDLVENLVTGHCFPVGDIDSAARFVHWCVKNPAAFDAMREASRKRVTADYNIRQFANAIVEAVDSALARKQKNNLGT